MTPMNQSDTWETESYMSVDTVGHELRFTIRGDEGYGAVVLKARQAHTLVKLHVLHCHRLTLVSYKSTQAHTTYS